MEKIAIFVYKEEEMCFVHVLLNGLAWHEAGADVRIIFEGGAVKLPSKMGGNPLYQKAKEAGILTGICEACSKAMGVYDANKETGLPFLNDLNGHPSMPKQKAEGFDILVM